MPASRLASFLALACLWCAPAAAAATPRSVIAGAVAAQLQSGGGQSGVWVSGPEADPAPLVSIRAATRRTPASLEKLLTSSTVLARFGEDTRLKTVVRTDGELGPDGVLEGDIYLQGFGDPSFGPRGIARLARAVRQAGVLEVSGRVYGDESYLDSRRGLPAGGFRMSSDIGPLSALSFNEGRAGGFGFQPNPPSYVAGRLRAALVKRGISVAAGTKAATTPASAEPLASVQSPPVRSLVRHMNQTSDNYFAETLLKGLGARFGRGGSTTAGAAVVTRYERSLGVEARILDGSGLSRGDAISPQAVGRLLVEAEKQPWFDSFYRSLPLAGHSGTLKKRMRGTSADGRCRAKTGTLIGVSALAGYCRTGLDHRVAFAVLMNGVDVTKARRAQDRIAATLAGYPG